jgi:hypothetical protein
MSDEKRRSSRKKSKFCRLNWNRLRLLTLKMKTAMKRKTSIRVINKIKLKRASIGRIGRFGKSAVAINLLDTHSMGTLDRIQNHFEKPIENIQK